MGNYDRERAERDFRVNTPNTAPGQGDNSEWGDDIPVGSSSIIDDSAFSGSNLVGSTLDSMNNNHGNTNNMNNFNSQGTDVELEVAKFVGKAAISGGKGAFNFVTALFKSFSNNTSNDWHVLGSRSVVVSIIVISVGLFLVLLKPLLPSMDQPQTLIVGGCISAIVGCILLDRFKKDSDNEDLQQVIKEDDFNDVSFSPDLGNDFDSDFSFDKEDVFEENTEEEKDEWADFENDFFIEDDEDEEEEVELTGIGTNGFNIDDSIDNIYVEKPGIWTRQYLFETYCKILPNNTPSYNKMKSITVDTDEFMMFSEILRGAASQVGTKEENLPELEEVRKGIFLIQLRASRPAGLKEQEIADLVANEYSRDTNDNIVHEGVYATVNSRIGVFIINIFTGNNAIVTLKDIYSDIKDFMLDTDVSIPFVWGIGDTGSPYYCDLIDCDSILISGEGRGGKSWKGQSILAQLAMYNSPKELEFYIFDHKDKSSDYRYPSTVIPHVKYFCGNGKKICEGLQKLIDYTLNVTGKILSDDGKINIKDYNKFHPDNKLPYRYIIVDELQSLMDSYDKDEQAEFRRLTSTIVSKLPYLGLRLVMFPHRIVDYVISKNTYSLISTRAVVRQLNEDEIKNALGVTKRQFPYKLVNKGDMAIKSKEIAKGEVVYCHAEVLTDDGEKNKDVFKYIGSVWKKLCPECECITIDERTSIGGRIGNYSVGNNIKEHRVVDHTVGMKEYNYAESSSEDLYNIDKAFEDLDNNEDDEEAFWNDVFNDSTEGL